MKQLWMDVGQISTLRQKVITAAVSVCFKKDLNKFSKDKISDLQVSFNFHFTLLFTFDAVFCFDFLSDDDDDDDDDGDGDGQLLSKYLNIYLHREPDGLNISFINFSVLVSLSCSA